MHSVTKRISARPERKTGETRGPQFVAGSAIQVFVLRVDAFLGTELFGAEVPVSIGRHRDCSIRLDDDTVSRVHCRIVLEGERLFIEDSGSANGTLLNSERIQGRTEVMATDAVQVGDYTLKIRGLIPRSIAQARPTSGISDKATRKKAWVSADGFVDTHESLIDLERKVDPRLYEAALRRATGVEPPKTPVPLVVVDGGRKSSDEEIENEYTRRDDQLLDQIREAAEPPTSRGFEIDPGIDKRINELEQAVQGLKEEPRKSKAELSPAEKPSESRNVFGAWVDLVKESPVDELARAIGTAASHRPGTEPWQSSKRKVERQVSKLKPARTETVRARRARGDQNVPLALSVPREIPVTDRVRARAPKANQKPRAPKRDLSALRVTPVSLISDHSLETEQLATKPEQASRQVSQAPVRVRETPSKPRRRMLPARLVTPTGFQVCVDPLARKSQKQSPTAFSLVQDKDIVGAKKLQRKARKAIRKPGFRAIEITTRQRGRLVDIATLSQNGEQYILGYPTPQGAKAPSCGHVGLRMIRVNSDRTVDLVFPRDAGGHLMRDGEAVMFSELTQGRKYSSVRLAYSDQVTLILNNKGKQVAYHVRFLQNPHL